MIFLIGGGRCLIGGLIVESGAISVWHHRDCLMLCTLFYCHIWLRSPCLFSWELEIMGLSLLICCKASQMELMIHWFPFFKKMWDNVVYFNLMPEASWKTGWGGNKCSLLLISCFCEAPPPPHCEQLRHSQCIVSQMEDILYKQLISKNVTLTINWNQQFLFFMVAGFKISLHVLGIPTTRCI